MDIPLWLLFSEAQELPLNLRVILKYFQNIPVLFPGESFSTKEWNYTEHSVIHEFVAGCFYYTIQKCYWLPNRHSGPQIYILCSLRYGVLSFPELYLSAYQNYQVNLFSSYYSFGKNHT